MTKSRPLASRDLHRAAGWTSGFGGAGSTHRPSILITKRPTGTLPLWPSTRNPRSAPEMMVGCSSGSRARGDWASTATAASEHSHATRMDKVRRDIRHPLQSCESSGTPVRRTHPGHRHTSGHPMVTPATGRTTGAQETGITAATYRAVRRRAWGRSRCARRTGSGDTARTRCVWRCGFLSACRTGKAVERDAPRGAQRPAASVPIRFPLGEREYAPAKAGSSICQSAHSFRPVNERGGKARRGLTEGGPPIPPTPVQKSKPAILLTAARGD